MIDIMTVIQVGFLIRMLIGVIFETEGSKKQLIPLVLEVWKIITISYKTIINSKELKYLLN